MQNSTHTCAHARTRDIYREQVIEGAGIIHINIVHLMYREQAFNVQRRNIVSRNSRNSRMEWISRLLFYQNHYSCCIRLKYIFDNYSVCSKLIYSFVIVHHIVRKFKISSLARSRYFCSVCFHSVFSNHTLFCIGLKMRALFTFSSTHSTLIHTNIIVRQ